MHRMRKSLFLPRMGIVFFGVALLVAGLICWINEAKAIPVNKSYISAFEIKDTIDGSAPFDADNNPGNDQNSSNGICRTFDHVAYNLSYITKLMSGEAAVSEGNLMVEFALDVDPSVAEFDTSTLNWLLDRKYTYTYSDGTTSSTWDATKTVTKQTLVGRRHLTVNETGSNAIPGAGSLSAGLLIKAAKHGQKITPSFTIYMEGNAASLKKTTASDTITVSAAPRYDIEVGRNIGGDPLAWFNTQNGTIGETKTAGAARGRLEVYGITVGLYNTDADHGLKGVELPSGDITFDITLKEKANVDGGGVRDVTNEEGYRPFIWDYNENKAQGMDAKGHLNRQMAYALSLLADAHWAAPLNSGGASSNNDRVYDGGSYNIVQDATQKNVYHVTLSNYKFDLSNLYFPVRNYGDSARVTRWGKNIGMFSAAVVQTVLAFPESVSSTETVTSDFIVSNFKANTATQSTSSEMLTNNNTVSRTVTTYPTGSFSNALRVLNSRDQYVSSDFYAGDGYASPGDDLKVWDVMSYVGDGYLGDGNVLIKFDPELVELSNTKKAYYSGATSPLTQMNNMTTLYAAKADKTTWSSDQEMNDALEEHLVYFKDYDELISQGYTCVGILMEVRDAQMYNRDFHFKLDYKAKTTAQVGKVYQFKIEARTWRGDGDIPSWTNWPLGGNKYGLANTSWTRGNYTSGYPAPTYNYHLDYQKSIYENGTMTGGHTNGYQGGQSMLMIGAKNRIEISVNDKETTDTGGTWAKSIYDLDKGERTAEFKIHPELNISSADSSAQTSNRTATVTVKAILPKDLIYITGSASKTPSNVSRDSGTGITTITWTIEGQKVGEAMDDILFKTTIGAAGTINDVHNNDSFEIESQITSTADNRALQVNNGNISKTSISVIKLATSSISKTVTEPLVESGQDISFNLHYGNSDEDSVEKVRMVDVLPYDGDIRGSNFTGSYLVKKLVIDFKTATDTYNLVKNNAAVYYTTDTAHRNLANAENIVLNNTGTSWTRINGGVLDDSAKTITFDNVNLANVVAIYYSIGDMQPKEYVSANVVLTPKNTSGTLINVNGKTQEPGNVYANNFYEFADNQIGVVTSNNVSSQVVTRTVSGVAWYDANNDGLRNNNESIIPNAAVNIYDATGARAKTVLGTEIAEAKTNASGAYSFDMLPAGNYVVKIEGGDYGLAKKDIGSDDKIDSDATPAVANGTLTTANIAINDLPAANAMLSYHYESENNDAGFTRATLYARKEKKDGSLVAGAKFSFADNTYNASDGMLVIPNLGVGTGTLTETEAPQGYKAAGPWTVRTAVANDGTISASIDGASKNGSAYVLTNYLKDSKIKNKITKSSTTTEITKKDQAVDYKIKYDVELTDYMGDAKVKIVDKLPHPIVEDQSELDGGVYDAENLTITWEEDWVDINTYASANTKSFEHNISLVYDGILGTDRELNNEATGHVTLVNVDAEPTNETEPGDEEDDEPTPIRIPGRIITKFIEIGTDKEVCKSDNAVGLIGDPYHTRAKECKDYELVKSPENEDYNFEENDQIVTYYYRKLENPNTADPITIVTSVGLIAFIASFACYRAFHKRR